VGLFTRTPTVDAPSVAERLKVRGTVVIDVRQPREWRSGHIRGSLNLPLAHLAERQHRLPKDKAIVVVCASGHRSAAAARMLRRAGFEVENLKGGMRSWARAGLPVKRP